MSAVLEARGLVKRFGAMTALDDVSFELGAGRTVGIVGESGSGKSTLGRICMGLLAPDAGQVLVDGVDRARLSASQLRALHRRIQLVPQDPRTSLNPMLSVGAALRFHLRAQRIPRASWAERVDVALEHVSLTREFLDAYPFELSGGQAQRVAIARALLGEPQILVCDEAVSALDKSVQAHVLNTLMNLQSDTGVALLFITHDLAVVDHVADTVVVLNRGRVVEQGVTGEVLDAPQAEYTRELLSARTPRSGPAAAPSTPHHRS